MYLSILEVSQKQAYIFSSNKLKENISNSAVIEWVLSPEYINQVLGEHGYSDEKNMVYSGGGHTILQFEDKIQAVDLVGKLTEEIYRKYGGLTVFVKTEKYIDSLTPQENLKALTKKLEQKKSIRMAAFHQGSYGIEKVDSNMLSVVIQKDTDAMEQVSRNDEEKEKKLFPDEFELAKEFSNLGGTKNEKNFIAVVHIDGNGMGARVQELYDDMDANNSWNDTRLKLRKFSEGVAKDFLDSYKEMAEEIASQLEEGKKLFSQLALKKGKHIFFPIRRVITAGDDICFVAEGRIGVECARIFIEKLSNKKNSVDGKSYSACAGVAIVHQSYPFYRAYELSEMLCSNAKKYGAQISRDDNGRNISSIDWHIEYGELGDSLSVIRKNYETSDGNRLEMRPYIVCASKDIKDSYKDKLYDSFKKVMRDTKNGEAKYATGKVKNLRSVLKSGEYETEYYLKFNRMDEFLKKEENVFTVQSDNRKHSKLFDAIELMDVFIEI